MFHSKQSAIVREFPEKTKSQLHRYQVQDLEDGMRTFCKHAQVFQSKGPPAHMYT